VEGSLALTPKVGGDVGEYYFMTAEASEGERKDLDCGRKLGEAVKLC